MIWDADLWAPGLWDEGLWEGLTTEPVADKTVPVVVGLSKLGALTSLIGSGLTGSAIGQGTVVEQSVAPGTLVPSGTLIGLTLEIDTDDESAQDVYSTIVTGLPHLEGKQVVVWGDGRDLGSYLVSGGQITVLSLAPFTSCVVGLGYQARWKSAKQAFGAALGTPLNQRKRIAQIGFILVDTHCRGVEAGGDFDHLYPLPQTDARGADGNVDLDHIHLDYDMDMTPFDDSWNTDSRVCLVANAPRPACVLACTITMDTHDKA